MSMYTSALFGLLCFAMGCRSDKIEQSNDSDVWWETDTEKQDEYTDDDKDDSEYSDCGENFDSDASCEGGWEETICLFEDVIWWCDNGIWVNEDDK